VDVINIAADHQIFMTLTGELTFTQKNENIAL